MFRKRLNNEAGYSLIEVMVSIIILAIAILPMAGMIDMGLNSATEGSQYDKARALANMKLEEAKSLPFAAVRDDFPPGNGTPYNDPSTPWPDGPSGFEAFDYRIEKQFMTQPSQTAPSPFTFNTNGTTPTGLIRVTVIVGWDYNPDSGTYKNTYTTYGLVSQ